MRSVAEFPFAILAQRIAREAMDVPLKAVMAPPFRTFMQGIATGTGTATGVETEGVETGAPSTVAAERKRASTRAVACMTVAWSVVARGSGGGRSRRKSIERKCTCVPRMTEDDGTYLN